MIIHDGGYQLTSGDGTSLSVTVRSGKISSYATPGPHRGVIHVPDKTFSLCLSDEGVRLLADTREIEKNGRKYSYVFESLE